jgi:hypothetical protein
VKYRVDPGVRMRVEIWSKAEVEIDGLEWASCYHMNMAAQKFASDVLRKRMYSCRDHGSRNVECQFPEDGDSY